MARWVTARWLLIVALVVAFDALAWFFGALVFVNENCEGSDYWACGDVVRDLARALIYATPVLTVAAMFLALHAWGKRLAARQ